MTLAIAAAHLLLPSGWVSPGYLIVDDDGTIRRAAAGAVDRAELTLNGFVVPGMANLHSHAHHRGLVGHADRLQPGSSATLWSWRAVMYRHVLGLTPEDLQAYATLAYVEMLRRGYTSVGEFHYIHHDLDGARYANAAEMSERIVASADTAGIALTILPTFYTSGGVGRPAEPEQRRFTTDLEEYMALVARLDELASGKSLMRVGVAPHSLRAVSPSELTALLEARPTGPVHIHAAERTEEVQEILAGLGARPVEWLLAEAGVAERWCVIHATHMTAAERRALAVSGAVVGVCPLTEANLADGRFPLAAYRHDGGRLGVGTDANHSIDLSGELRMLEYGQRLADHRRETVLAHDERSVGAALYRLAGAGGAQALGQPTAVIEPGARCDLVELDPEHPALLGQTAETVLDAWIFSSSSEAIVRTVLVAGRPVVSEGRHPHELAARRRVAEVMRRSHEAH
ncbi:MAG: formimidoylglutamate deiminase [Solirubrobacteraceae bacterium]